MNAIESRITTNEKRLDNINETIIELNKALEKLEKNNKELEQLKKYYGSKNWFKDKESLEKEKIKKIKAGVLSEDAVWNTLDELDDLIKRMKTIIRKYKDGENKWKQKKTY